MFGYTVPLGWKLPVAPYPPPYPRLMTGGVGYAGVAAIMILTMTSANLATDPVDNALLVTIDGLPAFEGPGGVMTSIRIVAQRDVDTIAPVVGTLDIYVTVDGSVTTKALLAQAVVDAVTATKAAFYPGIPFTLTRVGDAVVFTWDYAAAFPNKLQGITDTDWSTNEADPFFSGGFDAQALLPARRGPPYAWLPVIFVEPDPRD